MAGVSLCGSSKAGENAPAKDSPSSRSEVGFSATRMNFARRQVRRVTVEDRLRGGGFSFEHRPFRNIAVPLDQRRNRAASADDDLEELPHRVGNRAVMAVDKQKIAFLIGLYGMSRQMYLAASFAREVGEITKRGISVIGGRDEDVVDVEQQPAAAAAYQLANEVSFAHRRLAKHDIGGRVFEKDRPADRHLRFVNVIADASEGGPCVWQRQQVIEKCGLMGRPGQML